MAQIMIRCPVSNHAIATAVEVMSDPDLQPPVGCRLSCQLSSCGFNHTSISTPATRNKVHRKLDDRSLWSVASV